MTSIPSVPLAERMRPHRFEDIIGQEKLLGKGKPLASLFVNKTPASFLIWGAPGTGKTTIARLFASTLSVDFYQLNAVSSGIRDLRAIFERAEANKQEGRQTLLFIDEIHRFNKAQQDALLGVVEAGLLFLIGATTENPSFEVIPALRSRMRIFLLETLTEEHIMKILHRALAEDEFLKSTGVTLTDIQAITGLCDGDGRKALNLLEASVLLAVSEGVTELTPELISEAAQKKNILYDNGGEEHYNVISAFIKSIRGSDPDAAIYWLARMIAGGEDALFIARRMIILASEDIGNASPNAIVLAEACFSAVEKIGMPEGRIILAQCAAYLASQPKSNASYMAIESALADVEKNPAYPVPLHLRNAPTKYMKNIGYGDGYKYPHSFPGNFVKENYLPEKLKGKQYYYPTENGLEKQNKERLSALWTEKNYSGKDKQK